jgi:T4 RnlA family RNA ligase
MKIDFPKEKDGFKYHSHEFCGLDSFLIIPEIDAKWNKDNLCYRSLIIDKEGNVLSSGFPKFFNYKEKPDCYPDPKKFQDWTILNKMDGSLLIADFVNGVFSMRTRGTATYKNQKNYKDFELLPQKYPKITEYLKCNQKYSLLFEILTPNNVIVIQPKEIDFYFLGAVNKETLQMVNGEELLTMWRQIGCPLTPEQYVFNSFIDIETLYEMIKQWKGKEGIVLLYNNGQNRIKLKSDWYCFIHSIKSQLNSESNLIEYYVESGMPDYDVFYKKIETEFDFELAQQLNHLILKVCNVGNEAKDIIKNMNEFVLSIRNFENRKDQAQHIISTYGKLERSSFVFSILDGKQLSKNQLIKLIHQIF